MYRIGRIEDLVVVYDDVAQHFEVRVDLILSPFNSIDIVVGPDVLSYILESFNELEQLACSVKPLKCLAKLIQPCYLLLPLLYWVLSDKATDIIEVLSLNEVLLLLVRRAESAFKWNLSYSPWLSLDGPLVLHTLAHLTVVITVLTFNGGDLRSLNLFLGLVCLVELGIARHLTGSPLVDG